MSLLGIVSTEVILLREIPLELGQQSRLIIVVGHFGSGKTEFAVNLALWLSQRHERVALADLDVVDPYFRSRECAPLLAERGIRLISSAPTCMDADLPSMPPEVMVLIDDQELCGVLDIGGDASGARVLARYRHQLKACGAQMLCVVNANRPQSDTAEKMIGYIRSIEKASGIPIDGLVNNTHLCRLTTQEDVLAGAELAQAVSKETGIPVVCHSVPNWVPLEELDLNEPVFQMEMYMKKPWE